MRVRYDLSIHLTSFDFCTWVVLARARGARHVVFGADRPKTSKWDLDTVRRRLASILIPTVELAGLTWSCGEGGEDIGGPNLGRLVAAVRAGLVFERLRSRLPAGRDRYTVTLRHTARRPERNSDAAAWRAFAAEIGATVIEDYDDRALGLHERVALYAGAEMNFFVTNGPMHLCSLTPYPMLCMAANKAAGAFQNVGIAAGEQLPWALPQQRLVWEDDTLPNLRTAFAAWQTPRARAAA